MYPLSSIYFNCKFNSTNFGVLILYGSFYVDVAPSTNSIENSTSLWGGHSKISIRKTSWNGCKIGYLFITYASSTSLPLSLEIWTTDNTPFSTIVLCLDSCHHSNRCSFLLTLQYSLFSIVIQEFYSFVMLLTYEIC